MADGDDRAQAAINKLAHASRGSRRVYPPFMRVDFVVSVCAGTSQPARRTRTWCDGDIIRVVRDKHNANALILGENTLRTNSGSDSDSSRARAPFRVPGAAMILGHGPPM